MPIETKNLRSLYLRKNLSLAWPLALNSLLMQSMLIIDTLLVSPLGEIPLAAVGIASTVIALFLGLQFAIGNGTQLIIGRIFGANDNNALVRALTDGMLISLIAALLFVLGLLFWSEPLVALLTEDSNLAGQVLDYLAISQYILLFNAATQVFTVFLNGQGDTKTPFIAYLIELPFNALASFLLIFGVPGLSFEGLGVTGAAYGSLASVMLRFVILSRHISKLPALRNLNLIHQFNTNEVVAHFREILPIATNFLVLSVGNTLYLLLFSQLNIYSYVAVTLIFPWLRIATQIIVAWAQANSISITQAVGQGDHSHIKPIVTSCIQLGLMLAFCVALALYGLSLSLGIIYPNVEPETMLAMASIMPLYVLLPLIRTYNTIAGNSLRAMGKSVQVLKIHFVTQWFVVLPLCALFILYYQLPLFWAFALLPIEELIKAIPFYRMLDATTRTLPN